MDIEMDVIDRWEEDRALDLAGLEGFAVRRISDAEPGEEGWECSATLGGGEAATAQGYTPVAAILVALCDLEEQARRPAIRLVWSAPDPT